MGKRWGYRAVRIEQDVTRSRRTGRETLRLKNLFYNSVTTPQCRAEMGYFDNAK